MSKNTSVTLGSHFEDFINKQIQKGRYGSTSETVRAALRLLEEKEVKLESLRKAIIEGEESGRAEYSLDSFLEELNGE